MANQISVAGNVTREPELKFLNDGTGILGFAVADNQFGKDKKAIFWNCSVFGNRAQALSELIVKGNPVTVFGNVTQREWTDDQGQLHQRMEIRVNEVQLQGGKREQAEFE